MFLLPSGTIVSVPALLEKESDDEGRLIFGDMQFHGPKKNASLKVSLLEDGKVKKSASGTFTNGKVRFSSPSFLKWEPECVSVSVRYAPQSAEDAKDTYSVADTFTDPSNQY